MVAKNGVGYSAAGSGATTFTTTTTVPSAPRNVTVSSVTAEGAQVSWLAPTSNGGSTILAYKVSLAWTGPTLDFSVSGTSINIACTHPSTPPSPYFKTSFT